MNSTEKPRGAGPEAMGDEGSGAAWRPTIPRVGSQTEVLDRIFRARQALGPGTLARPQIEPPGPDDAAAIALAPGAALPAASIEPAQRLGDLSMIFETGTRPGQEAKAAATVSTGSGDPGGVSYGAYQLASSERGGRRVQAFLEGEGAPWAPRFDGQEATARDGAFADTWRSVATEDPAGFFDAQHRFIERTHYQPVVDGVARTTGLDVDTRSGAVRNAVWSMAVQHHGAPRLVAQAIQDVSGKMDPSDPGFDRALINRLYDVREAYVRNLGQPGLLKRYRQERAAALRMLP